MEFCPTCETLLKKNNNKLVCPKCEYVKKIDKTIKEKPKEPDSDFLVMGESDMSAAKGLKSTIKIDCEKCHNHEGVWWSLQTRSADEPETRFYRCVKCNYTWRDYT
ncbi:MAG: transcription factor S [Thermoproteota archaeon]|nr:transcription factor S [Thermoproteota archaeon]